MRHHGPTGLWPDWLDDAASAVGDGISTAWNATTTWVDEHQADIVAGVAGTVVGGGCLLLTAGAGSVACGALGGAAAGAATHAWRAQVQHTEEFSWGALGREALIGGTTGAATAGIGQIPGVRQAANRATAAVSSAFRRPPMLTPQQMVEQTARAQYARGPQALINARRMTSREGQLYLADPVRNQRFLGTSVHRATARTLEQRYPGQFRYNHTGPDFTHIPTGTRIELTTVRAIPAHVARAARDARYASAQYATYR